MVLGVYPHNCRKATEQKTQPHANEHGNSSPVPPLLRTWQPHAQHPPLVTPCAAPLGTRSEPPWPQSWPCPPCWPAPADGRQEENGEKTWMAFCTQRHTQQILMVNLRAHHGLSLHVGQLLRSMNQTESQASRWGGTHWYGRVGPMLVISHCRCCRPALSPAPGSREGPARRA